MRWRPRSGPDMPLRWVSSVGWHSRTALSPQLSSLLVLRLVWRSCSRAAAADRRDGCEETGARDREIYGCSRRALAVSLWVNEGEYPSSALRQHGLRPGAPALKPGSERPSLKRTTEVLDAGCRECIAGPIESWAVFASSGRQSRSASTGIETRFRRRSETRRRRSVMNLSQHQTSAGSRDGQAVVFSRVLVGVDGTEPGFEACRQAARFARDRRVDQGCHGRSSRGRHPRGMERDPFRRSDAARR